MFGAMSDDLQHLSDWLVEQGRLACGHGELCQLLEAVFNVLEPRFELLLVNSQHLKAVEASGLDLARPQLLRARALLCERDGDPRQAIELLQSSVEIAR